MTTDARLLPCPFCGSMNLGGPHFSEYIGDTRMPSWWVECKDCPCWLEAEGETQDALVAAWNRRTQYVNGGLRALLEGLECEEIDNLMTKPPEILRAVGVEIGKAARLGADLYNAQRDISRSET